MLLALYVLVRMVGALVMVGIVIAASMILLAAAVGAITIGVLYLIFRAAFGLVVGRMDRRRFA